MAASDGKPGRKYTNTAGNPTHAGESSNMHMFDFGLVPINEKEALGFCPICFGIMTWGGATEDHLVTDGQFFSDYREHMSDDEYNAQTNLISVHHRCNASKNQTDLFAYWRANRANLFLTDEQYACLIGILDHLADRGRQSMTNVAPQEWKRIVKVIVRAVQNRDPDFVRSALTE